MLAVAMSVSKISDRNANKPTLALQERFCTYDEFKAWQHARHH